MAKRDTHLMKQDRKGQAVLVTYRTRKAGKSILHYRTLIMDGARTCTVLDWPNETAALSGHAQAVARIEKGEPILQPENHTRS